MGDAHGVRRLRRAAGAYYDGAQQLEPQRIAFEWLESAEFRWDFEAPPSFVVP